MNFQWGTLPASYLYNWNGRVVKHAIDACSILVSSEPFQQDSNMIFKPKLSFSRENHENDNYGEFPDFHESTLYDFQNFERK